MLTYKQIILAVTLVGTLASAGCDPVYRRIILVKTDGGVAYGPKEGEEAGVISKVDEVAASYGFAAVAREDQAPPRRGEEVLRDYFLRYRPDERQDKQNTLLLTVVRRASSPTIDVSLAEVITSRETLKYRQVFTELRRRLPNAQSLKSNWGDGG